MRDMTILGKPLDAFEYRFAAGLWVITPYYNPMGYRTRRLNYDVFIQILRRSASPS